MPTFEDQTLPVDRWGLNAPQRDYYGMSDQQRARQYQDEVDSADRFREQQKNQQFLDAGQRPPNETLAPGLRIPNTIHKSGDDIVHVDPITGQATVIYHHPASTPAPLKPFNPGYTTKTYETPEVVDIPARPAEKKSLFGMDWLWPDTPAQEAVQGRPAQKITERTLNPMPQVAPQSTIQPPLISVSPSTPYTPPQMMAPGETAPAGSIIIGRKNTLAAPPSTTQSTAKKRFVYRDGQLLPSQ